MLGMVTVKVTFDQHLLPRRFSWLRHHVCIISAPDCLSAHRHAGSLTMKAIALRDPSNEELRSIIHSTRFESLDYTASIFDVLGIDVSAERTRLPSGAKGELD